MIFYTNNELVTDGALKKLISKNSPFNFEVKQLDELELLEILTGCSKREITCGDSLTVII